MYTYDISTVIPASGAGRRKRYTNTLFINVFFLEGREKRYTYDISAVTSRA